MPKRKNNEQKRTTKRTKAKERSTVYSKPEAVFYLGKNSLKVDRAKELLDWETQGKQEWGDDYLLKDVRGQKVRCYNNIANRPFDKRLAQMLSQEILRGNWRLNGESIVIGKTGLILSGQHRLIALCLAQQVLEEKPEDYPDLNPNKELGIETLVVTGISEDDEVVNTLDTGKSRSLGDVIYRSETFAKVGHKERKKLAKMVEHSVRFLWHRTGQSSDAFNPSLIRTHKESLDFIDNHPTLIKCVEHIYEENVQRRISKYISPGYASGLMYLMGCAATDPDKYQRSDPPSEKVLEWSLWDAAEEFWVSIDSENMKALRKAVTNVQNEGGGSIAERTALIVKAWHSFLDAGKVSAKALQLDYQEDEDGIRKLNEKPTLGGIDIGDPSEAGISPQVIEQRKRLEREKGLERKRKEKKGRGKKDKPKEGDHVWVNDPDGAWDGIISEVTDLKGGGKIAVVEVPGVGKMEAPYSQIQFDEPL